MLATQAITDVADDTLVEGHNADVRSATLGHWLVATKKRHWSPAVLSQRSLTMHAVMGDAPATDLLE